MDDRDPLVIPSKVAHVGHVEQQFAGWPVYAELAGHETFLGMIALGLGGRRLSADEVGVLDDIAVCWTSADPRIWPLKVTRLAASYGGTIEGFAAGHLCMDARFVGVWKTTPAAARLLVRLRRAIGDRLDHPAFVSRTIERELQTLEFYPGFGVPYRAQDERIPPLRSCLERRGRHELPHWRVFEATKDVVLGLRGIHPNIGGACAAACLDIGLEPDILGPLSLLLAAHMFMANAHEAAVQSHPLMQRLPADRIRYVGWPPRTSPRAGGDG